jgi:hypothetical protein
MRKKIHRSPDSKNGYKIILKAVYQRKIKDYAGNKQKERHQHEFAQARQCLLFMLIRIEQHHAEYNRIQRLKANNRKLYTGHKKSVSYSANFVKHPHCAKNSFSICLTQPANCRILHT